MEVSKTSDSVVEILVSAGVAPSKSEARRLVDAGAVTHLDTDSKITSYDAVLEKGTYRVGKMRFFKIV